LPCCSEDAFGQVIKELKIDDLIVTWENDGDMMIPDWQPHMYYKIRYAFEGALFTAGEMLIKESMEELVEEQTPSIDGTFDSGGRLDRADNIFFLTRLTVRKLDGGDITRTETHSRMFPVHDGAFILEAEGDVVSNAEATIKFRFEFSAADEAWNTVKYRNFVTDETLAEFAYTKPGNGISSSEAFTVPSYDASYYPTGNGAFLYPLGIEVNGSIRDYTYILLDPN
jgi:hypothetical protein